MEKDLGIRSDKVTDIAGVDANDAEDDRAAIAKFKKPYKQLSDTEKETLEEDLDDRFTMDAVAYYSHTQSVRPLDSKILETR